MGKTWRLLELRGLEVLSVCFFCRTTGFNLLILCVHQPTVFNITLGRSYRWQTENPKDQVQFLWALVDLFRNVSNGAALQLSGMPERPGEFTLSRCSSYRRSLPPAFSRTTSRLRPERSSTYNPDLFSCARFLPESTRTKTFQLLTRPKRIRRYPKLYVINRSK